MVQSKQYTTIGMVHDYIVEKHQTTQQGISFPAALDALRAKGALRNTPPVSPPFYADMDIEAFRQFLWQLPIEANSILPQAHTFMNDPTIAEGVLFPENRDVFCFLNMPYIVTLAHSHNFFEITYVLKGSCTFLFEGESATLTAGDICIVSPGSSHSLPLEPDCVALATVVRRSTFDSMFANLLAQKDLLSRFFRNSLYNTRRANYILLKTGNDPLVFSTIRQLTYECYQADNYANNCAVNLLNLYLARALRAASNAITMYHYEGYSERDFDFALVLQYIQQNYRTVTLSSLADTFHFSETYLSKLVTKNMNQNFTEVLRTLKMNHAMDYLMNTSMKISEISDAVGYDSVDHFSRTFRKVYGMPPLEYRKQHDSTKRTEVINP